MSVLDFFTIRCVTSRDMWTLVGILLECIVLLYYVVNPPKGYMVNKKKYILGRLINCAVCYVAFSTTMIFLIEAFVLDYGFQFGNYMKLVVSWGACGLWELEFESYWYS